MIGLLKTLLVSVLLTMASIAYAEDISRDQIKGTG